MGTTESTGRSNRTEEEEDRRSENSSSGGGGGGGDSSSGGGGDSSSGGGGGGGDSSSGGGGGGDSSSGGGGGGGRGGGGRGFALAAAGTVMVGWGIYKIISSSSNSESKEKDNAMKFKAHENESSFPNFHNIYESMQYESKEPTVIWSPPPAGRLKMNTDAICKGTIQSNGVEQGPSWFAGILRNHRGEWVRGFLGFIDDNIDILTAEIYSINGGLELLDKDDRYKGSFLENDNEQAVNWINGKYDYKRKPQVIEDCWDIIVKSRQLARKNNITIDHVLREANGCADRLAAMAVLYRREKYVTLENRPDHDDVFERRYKQDLS